MTSNRRTDTPSPRSTSGPLSPRNVAHRSSSGPLSPRNVAHRSSSAPLSLRERVRACPRAGGGRGPATTRPLRTRPNRSEQLHPLKSCVQINQHLPKPTTFNRSSPAKHWPSARFDLPKNFPPTTFHPRPARLPLPSFEPRAGSQAGSNPVEHSRTPPNRFTCPKLFKIVQN